MRDDNEGSYYLIRESTATAWEQVTVDLSKEAAGYGFDLSDGLWIVIGVWTGNGDIYVDDINLTGIRSTVYYGENAGKGQEKGDAFGSSVEISGDMNGDGRGELVVGAPNGGQTEGRAKIYYGRSIQEPSVTTSKYGGFIIESDGYVWGAQAFVPKEDITLVAIELQIRSRDDCAGKAYVRINATSGNLPGSVVVSSVESFHAPRTLPAVWVRVEFSAPAKLSAGTRYWIVVNTSDAFGYLWYSDNGGIYSDGRFITNGATVQTGENATFLLHFEANVTLNGTRAGDRFGYSVSWADMDGDGYNDTIVGAPYNDTASGTLADAGAIYVFRGGPTMQSYISASSADYINYSTSAGAHFGFSVSKAGDVNGDGFNDVIAGSPAYAIDSGKAEILSCKKPPNIVDYDLLDSSGASRLNQQIDVNAEYHFIVNITHPNGWQYVDYVRVRAWYDFGSEATAYNDTKGGNINLFIEYENTTGTGIFKLLWPTGGEVVLGTCSDTVINSTTYSLDFNFTPMYQFRYAPGDGVWDAGPGFNDANSWNFEINVTDSSGWYDSVKDEFGIYRFTSVSASGNPSVTGYPGFTYAMTPSTIVTYSSNADFHMNVSLVDDLWNAGNTASIAARNVAINWTGHVPDSYVSFAGSGSANAIWIIGDSATLVSAPLNDTSQSITVYWQITIPAGTIADTYSATVNYTISQT